MVHDRGIVRRRAERGAAAAEFALVAGLLALLVFGLFDLTVLLNRQIVLVQAAREGVRRAMVEGGDTPEVREVIARQLRAGGIDPAAVAVAIEPRRPAYGSPLTVRLQLTVRPVTPVLRRFLQSGVPLQVEMNGRNERIRPPGT
ncbi:TadE/TadG family type IV pilus assembly protein [Thermaerobacter subterraneus]|uniref:TadE-like protein n=1 Tax=Thermaerobacter subterraneus DSM 13965 TaxID=867903 RepID=K6PZ11_9FIRM|nr:TadE/TadG family type IV pilus assembly protein [Thermaerobacter subterraneus]EKP93804.1 TadE-like protein [Thermaerobacter subterraneus DSM 13965]